MRFEATADDVRSRGRLAFLGSASVANKVRSGGKLGYTDALVIVADSYIVGDFNINCLCCGILTNVSVLGRAIVRGSIGNMHTRKTRIKSFIIMDHCWQQERRHASCWQYVYNAGASMGCPMFIDVIETVRKTRLLQEMNMMNFRKTAASLSSPSEVSSDLFKRA